MNENPTTQWPRRFASYSVAGAAIGLVSGLIAIRFWALSHATEWFYLPQYLRLQFYAGDTPANFKILGSAGRISSMRLVPKWFEARLAHDIYDSQTLPTVFHTPMLVAAVVGAIGIVIGGMLDARYNREARIGRWLKGPRLVSARRFNRETKGDGIEIPLDDAPAIRIARDREAHHIQIAGDTGSGKSTIVRRLLYQIEARNEVAIIFDPDREFVKEFFSEERGDWILNPKDDRCPYWPIGEEAADEAEATPIAAGLFPDGPTVQKFFLNHTRSIFAYLLANYRPTVAQLCHWMAHPAEIDARVRGTEHEHTLTENAAPQRAGILGSLNEAGKPLRMMPGADEGRRVWLAREWAKNRRGWIFITSTPDTLDALRPLQSLWLDMLILKLQGEHNPLAGDQGAARAASRRVWMILDEVASLNQLPQLHSALTRQRKSDNPIVLGFQGMSQIEFLYGKEMAQTILSQAFTNIVLRTREPRAARHLSELIGKQEIERVREQRPAAIFNNVRGRSYGTEKVILPVVMESEIQCLDDLTGYFFQLDKVVKIEFSPYPKRERAPGLMERMIPPTRPVPPAEPPPAPDEPLEYVASEGTVIRFHSSKETFIRDMNRDMKKAAEKAGSKPDSQGEKVIPWPDKVDLFE